MASVHPVKPGFRRQGRAPDTAVRSTHDVPLGARTLDALRAAAPGDVVALPGYDKSAHRGRGDRLPASSWTRIRAPLELVVLEGWMLGFPLVDMSTIEDRHLADAAKLTPRCGAWNRQGRRSKRRAGRQRERERGSRASCTAEQQALDQRGPQSLVDRR